MKSILHLFAKRRTAIRLILVAALIFLIWFLVVKALGDKFNIFIAPHPGRLLVFLWILLPSHLILVGLGKVHWSEVWLGLGVPLALLYGLMDSHTNTMLSYTYDYVYSSVSVTLLMVLIGGLVSAIGYFGKTDSQTPIEGSKPLSIALCCFLLALLFYGFYTWADQAMDWWNENERHRLYNAGRSQIDDVSPPVAAIIVIGAILISSWLLRGKLTIKTAAEAALFSAMLILVAGLIFYYSANPETIEMYEALALIHSGLEFSLLLYISLFFLSYTSLGNHKINTGLFNWHWLEIAAFFIFMLFAPETIREGLKNQEDDWAAEQFEEEIRAKLLEHEEALQALQSKQRP